LLRAASLRKAYGGTTVLDGLDLSLAPGAILGLVGPNGAGKTTLLNVLTGMIPADSGEVVFDGVPVDFDREPERRRQLGLMLGGRLLVPELRPGEYWDFIAAMHGTSPAEAEAVTAPLVAALRLETHLGKPIKNLSAGTQKKVEFIAAVVHGPRLLLLDEPFEAIDPPAVADLTRLTRDYVTSHGAAAIISSHILPYVRPLATEIRLLWRGRLVDPGQLVATLRQDGDDAELERWRAVLEAA
jgi:ABC-2 type transport system ATP-binding protein